MAAVHPLMTPREAADYLRSTTSTLAKQRLYGTGPAYVKMGRLVRYRLSDLDAWLAENVKTSTSEAA